MISTKDITNILGDKDNLNSMRSEKVEPIARIIALTNYVFNNEKDAVLYFIHSSHPELSGKTPYEFVHTELGTRLIEDILWKTFYGVY